MRVEAYAKINWHLNVLGKREDGYHELDMLMQQISLHDEIEILPGEKLEIFVRNASFMPKTEQNLAYRAADALRSHAGITLGASIKLRKNIPVGAGLGGGSADAAAVLLGLNELWDLHYDATALSQIGLSLGSDIPFCIQGGFARVGSRGEDVRPLTMDRRYYLVVIQPCRGLSTGNVFGSLNLSDSPNNKEESLLSTLKALQTGDYTLLARSAQNDLQSVSAQLRPQIGEAINALKSSDAKMAIMSGSGSAVFAVYSNYKHALGAYQKLCRRYRSCWLSHTLETTEPAIPE
jgi:4-diphosphocytidyl-2-C-methyl-D-erythritol kinase